ncbi:growth arrest and dna damage-inducible protein-interacting protein 1 gadd45gip1 [Holotrichia oblita]|uniref:Growth arrest and dna damage-inducible protein-interacting protein 1 gadd45gip1 n=2 Tax=Holotrichia oblita TaxID=644536 RepID=A0ACB9ST60_HOLOL|nr:growth arrest and dna damage-inducible protein-interacting protein 1 gadd45gip1 [Holotrichia oblita]KAI4462773.1 growth arrest and dna damage-inducible protein-interacting protein 1 gadd45gip1 [Holotrichia oblita]
MLRGTIFLHTTRYNTCSILINRCGSSKALDIEKLEQETSLDVIDHDTTAKEEELERKRNKSRLNINHRNILHGKPPYTESKHPFHDTLKYKRKMYGRYGASSGIDVQLCWPTREELADILEYEKVAYPRTILEMINIAKEKRAENQAKILEREEQIAKKILKLDAWIKELNIKTAKKQAEAQEAKERKEKLIEDVRRHFGYTVDPRDDRFKEMLEKKEKEQKKAMKEARKKAKEEQIVTRILAKQDEQKDETISQNKEN